MSTLKQPYDFGAATFLPFKMGGYFWKLMGWGTLVTVLLTALFIPLLMGDIVDFIDLVAIVDSSNNPDDAFAMFGIMGKMFLKAIPLILILWAATASLVTAFHRNAIFGEVRTGFPLRFGRTEMQVMLVQLVVGLIIGGLAIVAYMILGGIVVALGVSSGGNEGAIGAAIGLVFLLMIPLIIGFIYLAIRMSPAVAATVKHDRFALKDGWNATRGYFWWMFLSFIVIGVIGGIINQIVSMIAQFGLMGVFAASMDTAAMEAGDFSGLIDLIKSPGIIIMALIMFGILQFISLVTNFFSHGITSYVVRDSFNMNNPETVANIYD